MYNLDMNITKKDLGKEKTRLKRDQIDVFFDLVKGINQETSVVRQLKMEPKHDTNILNRKFVWQ